jgi:hypothetical protein
MLASRQDHGSLYKWGLQELGPWRCIAGSRADLGGIQPQLHVLTCAGVDFFLCNGNQCTSAWC